MIYTKKYFNSFEEGTDKQWLVTNGIGGFASSTIVGCNTRKYHGLLIGPKQIPYMRTYYVSKLNETVIIDDVSYDISTNECDGYISKGYQYQTSFEKEYFPTFEYTVKDITIKKQISMVYLENTTVIKYVIENKGKQAKMEFCPLVNYRDFHSTNNQFVEFSQIEFDETDNKSNIKIIYDTENNLYINSNCNEYLEFKDTNFNNMYYRVEQQRGLDCIENHFIPGVFTAMLPEKETIEIYFRLSTHYKKDIDLDYIDNVFQYEKLRQIELVEKARLNDQYANKLVVAADQFVIKEDDDEYGIIAGYPWFDEWGRDTFIAFEGLLLVTKRFDIARSVLLSNVKHIKDGIMPNTFNNYTGEGLYNSVDAGLWFFEAVYRYIKYTNDYDFVIKHLYKQMDNIIMSYFDGTLYNIHIDHNDGLLVSGTPELQLTWMDAKVGDYVVTPRNGKCVEINALWYNALEIMLEITEKEFGKSKQYSLYKRLADRCKTSFEEKFWNESRNCLYDVIEPYSNDIRPNQIMAVSLSFPIFNTNKSKIMVDTVQEYLYTPYGLRTLSVYDKKYIGKYYGDNLSRDKAYHQGTVWTWLMSEFVIGFCRVNGYSLTDRKRWINYLDVIKENLVDDCIDSISEIFDGDYPHRPNGAYAQAWSVGNILKLFSEVE